jgi:phosphorylase kinase alpha/beta subunit
MLDGEDRQVLLLFIKQLQLDAIPNVKVRLGLLTDFIENACREKIDYLHDFKFPEQTWEESNRPYASALATNDLSLDAIKSFELTAWEISDDASLLQQLRNNPNLFAQLEVLTLLSQRLGLDFDTGIKTQDGHSCSVRDLLDEVYARAGDLHLWQIVRRCAGLLNKYDINLEQAATEILVRQHGLTVGHAYSGKATLRRPADSSEILHTISAFNSNDTSQHILIQELIIYLGMLIKLKPELLADMHTIRVGHILQLIVARQKRLSGSSLDVAFNEILDLAPYQIAELLQETLADYGSSQTQLGAVESLHYEGEQRHLSSARFPASMNPKDRGEAEDWYEWREQQGRVGRANAAFYDGVWLLLQRSHGLVIGEKINSKRRIDSEDTLSNTTPGEETFKLHVNHLLNKTEAPVYRQLIVEALRALALIFQDNPTLSIDDSIYTDILIGHAVRLSWLQQYPEHREHYGDHVSMAWQAFYQLPPHAVANGILDALIYLLDNNSAPAQVNL